MFREIDDRAEVRFSDGFGVKNKLRKLLLSNLGDLAVVLKAYEIINAHRSQNLTIQNYLKSNISIYDHQIMAAKFVKNDMGGRALLADEVGLGKTIEAGILLKEYFVTRMIKNALILTPPSLRLQWQQELKSKFDLDFIMNKDDDRFKGYDRHPMFISSISSAAIPRNAALLQGIEWDMVVIDEAHRLKNERTKSHKFVKDLSKKFVLLLSATPIQNSLRELYNLVEIIRPGMLGSWRDFASTYTSDAKSQTIIPERTNNLQDLLQQAVIRTTRSEVKRYIKFTDRIPKTHLLDPTPAEIHLYGKATDFVRKLWMNEKGNGTLVLALMTLQRQISSSSTALRTAIRLKQERQPKHVEELEGILDLSYEVKTDTKMTRLREILDNNPEDKHLIFTEFRATQDYIAESLDERGIKSVKFNGVMSTADRDAAVGSFKRDAQIMVSTEAGGEGQNFQFCSRVVNYDLPWNPMRVEQRVGRVHRIGQDEDVHIHNMALLDSVEEYVLKLLFDKINLFKMTIGDLDLLFEDNGFENLPTKIFQSYMSASTRNERENKFSAIGNDLMLDKKRLHDTIMEFDGEVFANFNLSSIR